MLTLEAFFSFECVYQKPDFLDECGNYGYIKNLGRTAKCLIETLALDVWACCQVERGSSAFCDYIE